jgi:hypothetical protein
MRRMSERSTVDNPFAMEMKPAHTMYVMETPDVLALVKFEPHQKLLQQGKIREYIPEMDYTVIFASHQWTSDSEPDHTSWRTSSSRIWPSRRSSIGSTLELLAHRGQSAVLAGRVHVTSPVAV